MSGQQHASAALYPRERPGRARLKCDGTRAETRFGLSAKRSSPFKLARGAVGGGGQFSRLLAAEVCASAVVMLDTPCSEVECKTTGYPLHSHVTPSLPLPCVTVCHQVSTELYPLYRRLGGLQGRSGRAENVVPTGIRSRTVQPVVSRYTD